LSRHRQGFAKGLELAQRIAGNAALTNFAVMHACPHCRDGSGGGYAIEGNDVGDCAAGPDAKRV
jgi:hypothetical protein